MLFTDIIVLSSKRDLFLSNISYTVVLQTRKQATAVWITLMYTFMKLMQSTQQSCNTFLNECNL